MKDGNAKIQSNTMNSSAFGEELVDEKVASEKLTSDVESERNSIATEKNDLSNYMPSERSTNYKIGN